MCTDVSHASKHFDFLRILFLSVTLSRCSYPAGTFECKLSYPSLGILLLTDSTPFNRSPYHLTVPFCIIDHGATSESSSGYPKDCAVPAEWGFGNESTRRRTQWKASRLFQRCVIAIRVPHSAASRTQAPPSVCRKICTKGSALPRIR